MVEVDVPGALCFGIDAAGRNAVAFDALQERQPRLVDAIFDDGHIFHQVDQGGQGVGHLVGLGAYVGPQVVAVGGLGRAVVVGVGAVGQGLGLAHFLKDNRRQAEAEILVVEVVDAVLQHVEVGGTARHHQDVVLYHREVGEVEFIAVGKQLGKLAQWRRGLQYRSYLVVPPDDGRHHGGRLLAVVVDAVFVAGQVLDPAQHLFGGELAQLLLGQAVGERRLGPVLGVAAQGAAQDGILAVFEVAAFGQDIGYDGLPGRSIGFDVGEDVFNQLNASFHRLLEPREGDVAAFVVVVGLEVQAQAEELALDVGRRITVGAQVGQVDKSQGQLEVVVFADLEDVIEAEERVVWVVYVVETQAGLPLFAVDVAVEIGKNRRHPSRWGLEKAVGVIGNRFFLQRNGRDGGLLYFDDIGIIAFELVHRGVGVGVQLLLGETHDIGFGELLQPGVAVDKFLPGDAQGKAAGDGAHAGVVFLDGLEVGEFHIANGGLHEPVGEVALAQFFDFTEEQASHFLEGLSFAGFAVEAKDAVVFVDPVEDFGFQYFLFLVEEEVKEPGLFVEQHLPHQQGQHVIVGFAALGAPPDLHVGAFLAQDVLALGCGQEGLLFVGKGRKGVCFPVAKVRLDEGDGFVGIEVAGQA